MKTLNSKQTTNIYFIKDSSGLIKIGSAINVKKRLKTLQIGNPNKLSIIKIINNVNKSEEIKLHKKFKKYRIKGEWFSDEIFNLI